MDRSAHLALTFDVAFVVTLPPGFILAPDSTDIAPPFLIAGLIVVFGLSVYLGFPWVSGSKS